MDDNGDKELLKQFLKNSLIFIILCSAVSFVASLLSMLWALVFLTSGILLLPQIA